MCGVFVGAMHVIFGGSCVWLSSLLRQSLSFLLCCELQSSWPWSLGQFSTSHFAIRTLGLQMCSTRPSFSCGFQGWNSGCQVWWQGLSFRKPSCWPLLFHFLPVRGTIFFFFCNLKLGQIKRSLKPNINKENQDSLLPDSCAPCFLQVAKNNSFPRSMSFLQIPVMSSSPAVRLGLWRLRGTHLKDRSPHLRRSHHHA